MSVAKSSLLFAGGTLVSRFSGLLRDSILVGVFGASGLHDAFLVAFRIPNLLREMFAEGALGSSFTKVFSTLCDSDRGRAQRLLLDTLYLFFLVSVLISVVGMILAPKLVHLMTLMSDKGANETFIFNAVGLTRLLFPYLGLTILSAIVSGALHKEGRFFLSATSPVTFNVGNILGALWFAPALVLWNPSWLSQNVAHPSMIGVALGVLLGGVMQLLLQTTGIWKNFLRGASFRPRHLPWSPDLKRVVTLMMPAALAASTGPVNIFVNTNFATKLGEGAVTWLNYAFRLLQLPIGIFAVAVGAAVLPRLASKLSKGAHGGAAQEGTVEFQSAIELVLWLTTPCTVFLLLECQPVIRLLFEHGHFTSRDTLATAEALYAYSFGMLGYGLTKVLTTFYYAVERTTFAMRVALVSMFVNYVSNALLVDRFGHVGLAMTSSVVLTCNALILIMGILPHRLKFNGRDLLRTGIMLSLAVAGSLLVQTLCEPVRGVLDWGASGKFGALGEMVLSGGSIFLCFLLAGLWRLRKNPRQLLMVLQERLRRGPPRK